MTHRTFTVAVLATATLALGAVPALATHGAPKRHARIVRQAAMSRAARASLRADGISGPLSEVGAIGDDRFYTATDAHGRTCHLIGGAGGTIAVTYCPSNADEVQISAANPVIAAPFFVSPTGKPREGKLFRLVGFALPSVTRVVLVAPDGSLSDVPFQNGVFAADQPEADAIALRAFGKDGALLYEMPFR